MSVRPSRKNRRARHQQSPFSPVEARVLKYLAGDATSGSVTRPLEPMQDIARAIGSTESDVIEALLSLEKRGTVELPDSFHESIRREEVLTLSPKGEQFLLDYAAGNTEQVNAIAKEIGCPEEEVVGLLAMLATGKISSECLHSNG